MDPTEIAFERYQIIEPILTRKATLAEISRQTKRPVRTLYNWVAAFQEDGLDGLLPKVRSDKGKRRVANDELKQLIQGLFLRTPPVCIKTIFRQVLEVCEKNNWRKPSYDVVCEIIAEIPAPLKTLAHEGLKAYKQAFGLLNRFEADRPNEIWQADHTPLDILIFNEKGAAQSPWLTIIIDDYSRAIAGYFLGFQPPSSLRIALALRQAIWYKQLPGWNICGIPEKFYSDQGSDFRSSHIEQVAIELGFEPIQTVPEEPQGKGKCERFFLTINDMFLSRMPGYKKPGSPLPVPVLSLSQLEERFQKWMIENYLKEVHSETNMPPQERWLSFPHIPKMPASEEKLDLLLLTVAKVRFVRRDGIRFSGFRYFDVSLAGYVGEPVVIRYDPRDLSTILVYKHNVLICKAQCAELVGTKPALKDVRQARNHEAKVQRKLLTGLLSTADKHCPSEKPEPAKETPSLSDQPEYPKFKIRRFACDDVE